MFTWKQVHKTVQADGDGEMFQQERKRVKNYFSEIVKQYKVNMESIYMGGFSLGGKMSIDMAMTYLIPVKGVLAFCHGGGLSDSVMDKNMKKAVDRGIKFAIVAGEVDVQNTENNHLL